MARVTFTLDENTVAKLQDASRRLSKPKSEVVREAVVKRPFSAIARCRRD